MCMAKGKPLTQPSFGLSLFGLGFQGFRVPGAFPVQKEKKLEWLQHKFHGDFHRFWMFALQNSHEVDRKMRFISRDTSKLQQSCIPQYLLVQLIVYGSVFTLTTT